MSREVRAKFWVSKVARIATAPNGDPITEVVMAPCFGPGNESWSKYTPSGEFKMTMTNPDAADLFEPGQSYHISFYKAD